MSAFTLLACLAALVATCLGRVPSGYILQVKPACGSVSSQDAKISIVTDLDAEAKALCANGREVGCTSIDGVNFEILVSYPGQGNEECVFEKRKNTLVFVIRVVISYGSVGRFVHHEEEEYTVSCTFDPKGRDASANQTIVEGLIAPPELQTNLGENSNSTFALEMVTVLGASLAATDVHLGRTVMLRAFATGSVGIRPVSCNAIDGTSRYAILRAGCGDGIIFGKDQGFISTGNSTTSPYFPAFSINASPVIRFECNFVTCDVNACDGSSCENTDIDECELEDDLCWPNSRCTNTPGSYECICFAGYVYDPSLDACIDVDECSTPDICPLHSQCRNTNGSFACTCDDGFVESGRFCLDINECGFESSCPNNSVCINTVGSYECECIDGFGGGGCSDLNECLDNTTCHVHARCTNTNGSYTCTCDVGFIGDGLLCIDIDECAGLHTCHANAHCINTDGAYYCNCPCGHAGDGVANCSRVTPSFLAQQQCIEMDAVCVEPELLNECTSFFDLNSCCCCFQ